MPKKRGRKSLPKQLDDKNQSCLGNKLEKRSISDLSLNVSPSRCFDFEAFGKAASLVSTKPGACEKGRCDFDGLTIFHVDTLNSTMDLQECQRKIPAFGKKLHAVKEGNDWLVVVARRQLNGIGTGGKNWQYTGDGQIYATVHFRIDANNSPLIDRLSFLQIAVALAVQHAVMTNFVAHNADDGIPFRIKWPNDIMIVGKGKCGGIIVNVDILDEVDCCMLHIGIGLNLKKNRYYPSVEDCVRNKSLFGRETMLGMIVQQIRLRLLYNPNVCPFQRSAEALLKLSVYFTVVWMHKDGAVKYKGVWRRVQDVDEFGRLLIHVGEDVLPIADVGLELEWKVSSECANSQLE